MVNLQEPKIDGRTGEEVILIPEGIYEAAICEVNEPQHSVTGYTMPYMRVKVRIKNHHILHDREIITFFGGAMQTLRFIWQMRYKFQGVLVKITVKHEYYQGKHYPSAHLNAEQE